MGVKANPSLPPPIPVRSCNPNDLPPNADIAAEQLDYAGGVNPLGYKGHVFTAHGYGRGHASPARPPTFRHVTSNRQNFPVYDFGDDDDEDYKPSAYAPPSTSAHAAPTAQLPQPPHQQQQQQQQQPVENDLCSPLIGPVSPFVASTTLRNLGSSTLLPARFNLPWRMLLLVLSLATFFVTFVQNRSWLSYFQGGVLIYSTISNFIMLRRALQYSRQQEQYDAVHERKTHHGWDALMFQGASALSVQVFLSYVISPTILGGDLPRLTGPGYFFSISSIFFMVLTAFHIFDIYVTPVPFRLTYIVPIFFYGMVFSMFAIAGTGSQDALPILLLSAVTILISSFILHVFGRFVYIIQHKAPISADRRMAPITRINDNI